ncbi:UNVERIFIED_CONTAM: hypothetical protein Sindi_1690800 [Sesamum indicum]
MKKMQKEAQGHEETLKQAMEKAALKFPDTEDGQCYLEGYWASSCKEQLKVMGILHQERAFLDITTATDNAPDPFSDALASVGKGLPPESEEDLDNILGEVEAEVKGPSPLEAAIYSIARDLSRDGALKEKDSHKDVDACPRGKR